MRLFPYRRNEKTRFRGREAPLSQISAKLAKEISTAVELFLLISGMLLRF
jgi:hypothetical protein